MNKGTYFSEEIKIFYSEINILFRDNIFYLVINVIITVLKVNYLEIKFFFRDKIIIYKLFKKL